MCVFGLKTPNTGVGVCVANGQVESEKNRLRAQTHTHPSRARGSRVHVASCGLSLCYVRFIFVSRLRSLVVACYTGVLFFSQFCVSLLWRAKAPVGSCDFPLLRLFLCCVTVSSAFLEQLCLGSDAAGGDGSFHHDQTPL